MGRTTALRREIKRVFVPYVASKGFSPTRAVPRTFSPIAGSWRIKSMSSAFNGRNTAVLVSWWIFGKAPVDGVVDVFGKPVGPEDVLPSHSNPDPAR